jgi:hypothetical protein
MRHGEPDARAFAVVTTGRGGCYTANESWKYELPEGPIVLHFCASEALGTTSASTLVPLLPLVADMYAARIDLDIRFGVMEMELRRAEAAVEATAFSARAARAASLARMAGQDSVPGAIVTPGRISDATTRLTMQRGTNSIRAGLTTDTHPLDYKVDLKPVVQIFASSHSAEAGTVLVVFALPGENIVPSIKDRQLVYPLTLRVTAVDTAQGIVRTVDTVRYFEAADTVRKNQFLYGTLAFQLEPGSYYIRALLEQPARQAAGAGGRAEVIVPGLRQPFTLSDIITGSRESRMTWAHNGLQIPLNSLDAYRTGGILDLYYEVIGLEAGQLFTTSIEMARSGSSRQGKDRILLQAEQRADGGVTVITQSLELRDMAPGRYLLVIPVTGPGGVSARRERMVNIVRAN